MADRLRLVQGEHWRKMRYTDENEEAAWDVYNESMFLRTEQPPPQQQQGSAETGKEAVAERPLEELVPRFEARWREKKLLESISGIIKPEDQQAEEERIKREQEAEAEAEAQRLRVAAPSRARGGGAAGAAARRGGRTKTTARGSAGAAIDVD